MRQIEEKKKKDAEAKRMRMEEDERLDVQIRQDLKTMKTKYLQEMKAEGKNVQISESHDISSGTKKETSEIRQSIGSKSVSRYRSQRNAKSEAK